MKEFQVLGELIEKRWRQANYSEQLFPEIAEQALKESNLPERVDPWDVVRWVLNATALPDQKDAEANFGNPPITLFVGPRFFVDLYFWLDGTTSIHQHAFTGAFQVMLGSSIHSRYSFSEKQTVSEHFSVGELQLEEVQLLQKNSIRQIRAGRNFIHSLFHLDRPSATITVRTEHTPSSAVQYDYRKPYFAANPFFRDQVMNKKLQTVGLLLGMKHKDTDELLGDLITTSDFQTSYMVLERVFHFLRGNPMNSLFGLSTGDDRFAALMEKARSVHGELVNLIPRVLEEQVRQHDIAQRRGSITGEEHRFFLALLLNVSSREKILDLVKQRFPETDPVEKILDWVEELSQTRVLGSSEPNALGIEGFSDDHVIVLENLLRGVPPIGRESRSNTEQGGKLESLAGDLQNSTLFKGFLASRSS
ncbi:MAG TPA: hypothetical protein VJU86_08130 [Pyrinomonadaceae bacterium]|nr:hypothetical protein [Pyrinomonadaceae bacterium]